MEGGKADGTVKVSGVPTGRGSQQCRVRPRSLLQQPGACRDHHHGLVVPPVSSASSSPTAPCTISCPSGQLFRRLHRSITEGSHLLSHLNTEPRGDEHFGFKSLATSSRLSYHLQLHTRPRTEGHGAAKALAIPMNILQLTPVSRGRPVAVLENNSRAHHPTSKANQPLPV